MGLYGYNRYTGPAIYYTPDGQDLPIKALHTGSVTGLAGITTGICNSINQRTTQNFATVAGRVIGYGGPALAGGVMYALSTDMAYKVTGKDTAWNHCFGAAVGGATFGSRLGWQSAGRWALGAGFLCALAKMYAVTLQTPEKNPFNLKMFAGRENDHWRNFRPYQHRDSIWYDRPELKEPKNY